MVRGEKERHLKYLQHRLDVDVVVYVSQASYNYFLFTPSYIYYITLLCFLVLSSFTILCPTLRSSSTFFSLIILPLFLYYLSLPFPPLCPSLSLRPPTRTPAKCCSSTPPGPKSRGTALTFAAAQREAQVSLPRPARIGGG